MFKKLRGQIILKSELKVKKRKNQLTEKPQSRIIISAKAEQLRITIATLLLSLSTFKRILTF